MVAEDVWHFSAFKPNAKTNDEPDNAVPPARLGQRPTFSNTKWSDLGKRPKRANCDFAALDQRRDKNKRFMLLGIEGAPDAVNDVMRTGLAYTLEGAESGHIIQQNRVSQRLLKSLNLHKVRQSHYRKLYMHIMNARSSTST